MRIMKLKANGDNGAVLLRSGTLQINNALADEYCVVVDAKGIDGNGDPLAFRVTLTRNEVTVLKNAAERGKL